MFADGLGPPIVTEAELGYDLSGVAGVGDDLGLAPGASDAGIDGMEKVEEWLSRIVDLMSCLSGGFLG